MVENNNFQKKAELMLNNNSCNSGIKPGEMFYGNGWAGWILPNLSLIDICESQIVKGDAKLKGEIVHDPERTYITCPSEGSNCGILYNSETREEIGLYVIL